MNEDDAEYIPDWFEIAIQATAILIGNFILLVLRKMMFVIVNIYKELYVFYTCIKRIFLFLDIPRQILRSERVESRA